MRNKVFHVEKPEHLDPKYYFGSMGVDVLIKAQSL
jgi:hypothetical protein